MPETTKTTPRRVDTGMVMSVMLAKVQADGKQLEDLSPDDIKARVDEAVKDLRFAMDIAEMAMR